jgi:hypothetical protein
MNARTVSLALLAAIVTVPALADSRQPAGLSREDVKAEYIRARDAGELDFANDFLTPFAQPRKLNNNAAASASKIEALPATAAGKRDESSRSEKAPG